MKKLIGYLLIPQNSQATIAAKETEVELFLTSCPYCENAHESLVVNRRSYVSLFYCFKCQKAGVAVPQYSEKEEP